MICTNCGGELKDGAKFCTKCGAKVVSILPIDTVDPEAIEPQPAANQWQQPQQPAANQWQQSQQPAANQWQQPQQPTVNQWQQSQQPAANQWQQPQQPAVNQWQQPQQPTANQWQQPQQPSNDYYEPEQEKPKKNVFLTILLVLGIVIVIGLILAILYILFIKPDLDGKDDTSSDRIERNVDEDEDEDEEESDSKKDSKDSEDEEETDDSKEDPEESSKDSEPSESTDGSNNSKSSDSTESTDSSNGSDSTESAESSDPKSESSEASSNNSSEESSESKPEEPTTVKLACGAEIPLDAAAVDLSDYDVDSLEGIQQVTGLTQLTINGGELKDLSPLVGLENLKSLTINNVPVSSISSLSAMSGLTYLDLRDTKIPASDVQLLQALHPSLVIVGYTVSTYTIVKNPVNWDTAKQLCEDAGGHLATITSQEEYDKILPILKESGLTYVWLGATSESGTWEWVTGEPWGFTKWFGNEPSGKDLDGTVENRLCIWYLENEWTENDQRNNLPDILTGRLDTLGYLLETEQVSGIKP